MRINKYVALATGLSRRKADELIAREQVTVNGQLPSAGQDVTATDSVKLGDRIITVPVKLMTIMLNKPIGYVCSREGQGNRTIYELLPLELHHLKPVGRLDKDSSGLLLLTNDGNLANQLTHPSHHKTKIYAVYLDQPLEPLHQQMITDHGIMLPDGLSRFSISRIDEPAHSAPTRRQPGGGVRADSERSDAGTRRGVSPSSIKAPAVPDQLPSPIYQITMHEGRNRQIRRTFASLGYHVTALHRIKFGNYNLGTLDIGAFLIINLEDNRN